MIRITKWAAVLFAVAALLAGALTPLTAVQAVPLPQCTNYKCPGGGLE